MAKTQLTIKPRSVSFLRKMLLLGILATFLGVMPSNKPDSTLAQTQVGGCCFECESLNCFLFCEDETMSPGKNSASCFDQCRQLIEDCKAKCDPACK